MKMPAGCRRFARRTWTQTMVCALLMLAPAAASASDGDWFLQVSPPPSQPATVCMLDTGVNPSATAAGAQIVARDDVTATGVDDFDGHGTSMANRMISAFPSIRIVSVKMFDGQRAEYAAGLHRCLSDSNVKVIVLAVIRRDSSTSAAGPDDAAAEQLIAQADGRGVAVVIAAGNRGGAGEWPSTAAGAIPAVAAYADGQPCPFTAQPAGHPRALSATGCSYPAPDPLTPEPAGPVFEGTSGAAAQIAASIAAVASYTGRSATDSAALLRQTAAGTAIDLEAAFRAAGRGRMVDHALARVQPPAPEMSLIRRRRSIVIRLRNRPPGAKTVLTVGRRRIVTGARRLTVRGNPQRKVTAVYRTTYKLTAAGYIEHARSARSVLYPPPGF